MLFGGVLMALFWIGLIVVIFFVVRALVRSGSEHSGAAPSGPAGGSGRALDILKERYARGEITKEQYDQMREDLNVVRGDRREM